jgi:8-oxo-dGTP pyrophosphatase MutT (NUDIX family)
MTDAPPDGELLSRVAARVLLLDAADRVLLMRGFDPRRPDRRYWFTVGGGLDEGESTLDAAVRELFEETGLRLPAASLVGPVYQETTRFPFDGEWYEQVQDFFVARVDAWEADLSGFSEIERASIEEVRWWTLPDLAASTEVFYPADLVPLVRAAVDGRVFDGGSSAPRDTRGSSVTFDGSPEEVVG